jgi:hypothetical protein
MQDSKSIEQLNDAELSALAGQAERLADVPPGWIDAAVALWKVSPQRSARRRGPTLLTRLSAALSFDSWATPSLALGVRSMARDNRHLLFSTQGRDIDVRINASAHHFSISGQVLGPDEQGEVELALHGNVAGNPAVRTELLDSLGEFRFDSVARGAYQLTLRAGADEVVLPPIVIGEGSS